MRVVVGGTGIVRLPPNRGGAVEGYVHDILAASRLTPGLDARAVTDVRAGYGFSNRCVPVFSPFDHYPFTPLFSIVPHAVGGLLVTKAIRRELGSNGADLVHLNEEVSIARCKNIDLPKVVTVHSPGEFLLCSTSPAQNAASQADATGNILLRRLDWSVISSSLESYDGVIALNSAIRDALAHHGLRSRILPLPVDTQSFVPRPEARAGRDEVRLLYVGRLEPRKNVGVLLKAMTRAPSGSRLIVVGDGPLREMMVRDARKLGVTGRCTFVPSCTLEELVAFFQTSDIFLFPSMMETYGRVINEALSCGLPVVVPELPVYSDFLASGAVRSFRDIEELGGILGSLVDVPETRERLGERGRSFALNELSYDVFGRRLLEIYRSVLDGGGSG